MQSKDTNFLKQIVPPWDKHSFQWKYFNEEIKDILIFTDGSKINNRVGGAFVVFENRTEVFKRCFRLIDHTTVYSAAQTTIHMAIDYIINRSLEAANFSFADSHFLDEGFSNKTRQLFLTGDNRGGFVQWRIHAVSITSIYFLPLRIPADSFLPVSNSMGDLHSCWNSRLLCKRFTGTNWISTGKNSNVHWTR
ncbi:hypothetical protein CEXT_177031 [Caerostris extrusa]|uniref:RNase H type-1 domain-containing protein n=1 Tax=Caerostris extrusa TaxID=172846 RepID=A0AAV4N6A8_CAEEX|nr:hypothetical protein CEXT_177031 [Caerostris extrusa]